MSLLIEIYSCRDCPHFEIKRTKGAGYALDWLCNAEVEDDDLRYTDDHDTYKITRVIKGYIEGASEEPTHIPKWCPYRAKDYNLEKVCKNKKKYEPKLSEDPPGDCLAAFMGCDMGYEDD